MFARVVRICAVGFSLSLRQSMLLPIRERQSAVQIVHQAFSLDRSIALGRTLLIACAADETDDSQMLILVVQPSYLQDPQQSLPAAEPGSPSAGRSAPPREGQDRGETSDLPPLPAADPQSDASLPALLQTLDTHLDSLGQLDTGTREALQRLRGEIDKLLERRRDAEERASVPLHFSSRDPQRAKRLLETRLAESEIAGAVVEAEPGTGRLVVFLPAELPAAIATQIAAWVKELDQPPLDPPRPIGEGSSWPLLSGGVTSVYGLAGLTGRSTQLKLLELEIREAELDFNVAQSAYVAAERMQRAAILSEQELQAKQVAVERAHIKIQKLYLLREGLSL